MKRLIDLALTLPLALLALPVLAVVAVLIRLRLGAPVLFRQVRPGRGGVPFTLYKFRTMRECSDSDGRPLPDANRLTPLGRFLRSTSLDELPELWNVIRGDMSLVGPRPLLMEYLPLYSARQRRRHEVRPGLTGWAQVNGRNAISWEERFELDLWYVEHRSLLLDLRILLRTVGVALSGQGVAAPGEATMPPFRGSGAEGLS
jgi:lipopolysaccharide/colanic/teichoic acid biosynthesis glycosyltransferase